MEYAHRARRRYRYRSQARRDPPIVQKNEDELEELVSYGGHEKEFVDEVSEALICHICTKPLRDPPPNKMLWQSHV